MASGSPFWSARSAAIRSPGLPPFCPAGGLDEPTRLVFEAILGSSPHRAADGKWVPNARELASSIASAMLPPPPPPSKLRTQAQRHKQTHT